MKLHRFKCVWKPTDSQLRTHHANKSSHWAK